MKIMRVTHQEQAMFEAYDIAPHQGYIGVFTRRNAINAIRAGSRIRKIKTESGDEHPVGSTGTVLGSIQAGHLGIMYFIEWDDKPKFAMATIAWKIGVK